MIGRGPQALRFVRGRVDPFGRMPDADPDAFLGGRRRCRSPGSARRSRSRRPETDRPGRQVRDGSAAAPRARSAAASRRRPATRPVLARSAPFPGHGPQPLDPRPAIRRGRHQLVVIVAADQLELALRAASGAPLLLPHGPTANAGRDNDARWPLHKATRSSCPEPGAALIIKEDRGPNRSPGGGHRSRWPRTRGTPGGSSRRGRRPPHAQRPARPPCRGLGGLGGPRPGRPGRPGPVPDAGAVRSSGITRGNPAVQGGEEARKRGDVRPPQGMRWQRGEPSGAVRPGDEPRTSAERLTPNVEDATSGERRYRESQAVPLPAFC